MRGETGNKPVQSVPCATEGDGAGVGCQTSGDRVKTASRGENGEYVEVDRQPGMFR
jgi:hypothetical protein